MLVPMAVIMAWISLFDSTLLIRAFSTLMILPRSGRIAWKLRSRAAPADPPAASPSAPNTLAGRRVAWAGWWIGGGWGAGGGGGVGAVGGVNQLVDDGLALVGMLLEELRQPGVA